MRGRTIPVMDLSRAIGKSPIKEPQNSYVVITEFNRKVQGFLVGGVDRIVNMNWSDILPPPSVVSASSYVTAVTKIDDELVEIIDVEKVLSEVLGQVADVSEDLIKRSLAREQRKYHILVADDSSVARNQIKRTLTQLDIECTLANDGQQALDKLKEWADTGQPLSEILDLIISDVEMPEMDGYTLTTEIRKDPRLKDAFIILHTSLSGVFNTKMVESVGADKFIPKFNADELASVVLEELNIHEGEQQAAS
jgi:two-component system chemotaxis response regulator CheV